MCFFGRNFITTKFDCFLFTGFSLYSGLKQNIQETMNQLEHLISQLETKITHHQTTNTAVSQSSVGWQIEHSLKTIDQIISATKQSNPKNYQWKFNFNRFLILDVLQNIPRCKAKAPKIVQPEGEITLKSLQNSLQKVTENRADWNNLHKNAHFKHPFFGNLNKKATEKFLILHTHHHLKIINDMLKN